MLVDHLHQIAAHAWHAGELEVGRRACERLLRRRLPDGLEDIVRRNRTWYTQPLDELVGTRFIRIDVPPAHEGWSLFNPSIVATHDGWLVNVRSSNYWIVNGGYIMPTADAGRIRTENVLATYGDDLTLAGTVPLIAEYDRTDYPVDGLEDVRLNRVGDDLVVSATVRNFAGRDGTCRIGVGTVEAGGRVTDLRVHATPDGRHEKNWMPITGRPEWVYHCHAHDHLATVREHDDDWQVSVQAAAPAVANGFRGGSQLVPVGGADWLGLVHEVADGGGRRIYEHRFVLFREGEQWSIAGVSPAFAFRETRAIEFAAGLAVKGDRLVASFGVRDAEAWLCEMSVGDVLGLIGGVE